MGKNESKKSKMTNNDLEIWLEDSATLFYQIFSGEYGDVFLEKLKAGGGGNSFLGATWYSASEKFDKRRMSKAAYILACYKIDEIAGKEGEHNNYIRLVDDTVYFSNGLTENGSKYHELFSNNAKKSLNRQKAGKFFHYDHNPSNKAVFDMIYEDVQRVKNNKMEWRDFVEEIREIQKVDLITIYEDDIRTYTDTKLHENMKLSFKDRDDLLKDASNYDKMKFVQDKKEYSVNDVISLLVLPADVKNDFENALKNEPGFYNYIELTKQEFQKKFNDANV